MDPLIENLKSTTFFGKRLTRRQIADIQETVGLFPKLSRTELGHTICEHLRWQTPKGSNRIHLATRLLEELERLGILTLPARSAMPGRGPQRPITPGERTAPQPIGAHLRYFLRDRHGRQLGCLLFGFATRNLECRDTWIGWQGQAHRKHLDLVISNSRFLLFPWVQVKFLASKALALQRVLNTLLVVLFVFRLVFAPDRQGYALTLAELWEQCRRLGVALPQPQPVSASSICAARAKIHADVFRRIHRAILEQAPRETAGQLWHGHRIFAVDGSKLNLPRPLAQEGYRTPSSNAHYPQGLLSCLYQLRSRIPVDFDLLAHGNERLAALAHLRALAPGDVVVYGRGYYSFQLLHAHAERRLQAVFRLQRNASALFGDFILGDRTDHTVTVTPSADALRQRPQAAFQPCRVRLIKYTAGTTTYTLATTLLDRQRYSVRDLADLYHGRWSIEELYKISKQLLTV